MKRPVATLVVALFVLGANSAIAQKLDRRHYVDEQNGFKFQHPAKWDAVPVPPNLQSDGFTQHFSSKGLALYVAKLAPKAVDGETPDFESALDSFSFDGKSFDPEGLIDEKEFEVKDVPVHYRAYNCQPATVYTWTFDLADFDVGMAYICFDELVSKGKRSKWTKTFERSAKSFRVVDASEGMVLSKGASYEDALAYHQEEASRTPGWRALPTPSKKYVIKTSSDNDKFIKEVTERLELSRELYEKDFPPKADMEFVSVVRVCGKEEEFHKYGQTNRGVAGWFNPGTKELVLYDAKNTNRNSTYAVMSHEAFHQYCYFLFGRSEAHRWFDEGSGDYYGGARFKRGRAEITPRMPGGLDRLPEIRTMVRESTYKPVEEHLNYTHSEWQEQGPRNVSCYAQSWSIVYMLRQGTEGKVSKKLWKPEYADIIPNYVSTLYQGYQKAYEELRKELVEEAEKKEGKGRSVTIDIENLHVSSKQKKKIWTDAMEASWGQIDLDEFEENWVKYVQKDIE